MANTLKGKLDELDVDIELIKIATGATPLIGTAVVADVLLGKTFYNVDGLVIETGTSTFDADTSDGTAVAGDIALGKTAYVNGVKLTGTLV